MIFIISFSDSYYQAKHYTHDKKKHIYNFHNITVGIPFEIQTVFWLCFQSNLQGVPEKSRKIMESLDR